MSDLIDQLSFAGAKDPAAVLTLIAGRLRADQRAAATLTLLKCGVLERDLRNALTAVDSIMEAGHHTSTEAAEAAAETLAHMSAIYGPFAYWRQAASVVIAAERIAHHA